MIAGKQYDVKRERKRERVRERDSFSDGKWLVIAIITTAVITRHYIVRSKSIFSTGVVDDRRSRSPPFRDVDTMPSLMVCVHSTDEIASGFLYISLCSLLDGRVFFLLSSAVRRIMSSLAMVRRPLNEHCDISRSYIL